MRALGHKAIDVVVNDINGQEQWAKEHGVPSLPILTSLINKLWEKFSYLAARKASPREQFILAAQIKAYRPDVLYIHNTSYLSNSFLASIKKEVRLIVGQIAAPIPPLHSFFGFDLIITSLPHFVKIFKEMGISAEYLPLSFDPRILLPAQPKRKYPVTFVGSFFSVHKPGISALSQVALSAPLKIWGSPKCGITDPALSKVYQGEAWGKDMYQILQQSQITINRHSSIAKQYANNMRLFEATGCGAMLLTDKKDNLKDFFIEGREIVSYCSAKDLVQKVKYYLSHPQQRAKIAKAGQMRTMKDHTYQVRMKQLVKIIERYL